MSALVLVVGGLLLAAGGYEMYVGSGNILSERGWSAFIAGAVLVTGGIATMAIGLLLRAVDRLRGVVASLQSAAMRGRVELDAAIPSPMPAATPPSPHREPSFEDAPTAPILAAPPIALVDEQHSYAPPLEVAVPVAAPPPEVIEAAAPAEPLHDDWLDHSFADLEREMAAPVEPAVPPSFSAEPVQPPLPVEAHAPEAQVEVAEAPQVEPDFHGSEAPPTVGESESASQEAVTGQPVVSAREQPDPPPSAVIGRYESEGTSYVMYADGSIDAQSDAGVYRFASMAELKTFIES